MAVEGIAYDFEVKEIPYKNKDIYCLKDIKNQIEKAYFKSGVTSFTEDAQMMFNAGINFAFKQIDYKIMYLISLERIENK